MRELDLQVHNVSDSLEARVKTLFSNAKKLKNTERDSEFNSIRKDYQKVLEDADEKIQQANQMYDLVDRYVRRLDEELLKFKLELEADNRGITELLEKKSLELDSGSISQKENRYTTKTEEKDISKRTGSISSNLERVLSHPWLSGLGGFTIPASPTESLDLNLTLPNLPEVPPTPLSTPSRRVSSNRNLVDVTEAVSNIREDKFLGSSSASVKSTTPVPELEPTLNVTRERRRKKRRRGGRTSTRLETIADDDADSYIEEEEIDAGNSSDWNQDPNEPRYCLCNQVSYGDMVACDNPACSIEWFHYACVGIVQPPKGKWYCPNCSAIVSKKRRK
ncbi:inhibitor of growth protein 3-like isoform X2 [Artemia franciscana]|nr:hypothetical protein QYM36_008552 [Artemia franciscana]